MCIRGTGGGPGHGARCCVPRFTGPDRETGKKGPERCGAAFVSELSLSSLLYATGIPAGGAPCGERLGPVRGIRGGHSGQP